MSKDILHQNKAQHTATPKRTAYLKIKIAIVMNLAISSSQSDNGQRQMPSTKKKTSCIVLNWVGFFLLKFELAINFSRSIRGTSTANLANTFSNLY